ncbi:MAG: hypothetical protein JWO36_3522 [Myxococcales bacterium]|nr:hypothetical protein [Myxococcales bacterium]
MVEHRVVTPAAARSTRVAVTVTLGLVSLSLGVLLFVTRDLSLRDSTVLFLVELIGLAITMPFLYVGAYRWSSTEPLPRGTAGFSWFNCLGLVLFTMIIATMVLASYRMTPAS